MEKFEEDLSLLVKKLCEGATGSVSKEMERLKDRLLTLHKQNLVKINHSVMELICAKYLVSAGYNVNVEHILDGLSCDIYATKGLGSLIIEVETGFVPPDHALDPLTYCRSRIASKITRYSGYAKKFGLATPPHYVMQVPLTLVKPPRFRSESEVNEIKALCDLYYSSPPVSLEEIRNARIHAVYILDVDHGAVKENDPNDYIEKTQQSL